jgi:VanZ family protein
MRSEPLPARIRVWCRVAFVAFAGFATFLLLAAHPFDLLGLAGYSATLSAGRGQHVLLFAVLAFLGVASRWPFPRTALACLLAGYALATEGLQAFVPPRTPELADVAENLLGIAAGFALYAACVRIGAFRTPAS